MVLTADDANIGEASLHLVHSKVTPNGRMSRTLREQLPAVALQAAPGSGRDRVSSITKVVHLFSLLPQHALRIRAKRPKLLCTPLSFASCWGVELGERPAFESNVDVDADAALPSLLSQFPVQVKLKIAAMMYRIRNPQEVSEMVDVVLGIVLPPDEYLEMKRKLERKELHLPHYSTCYRVAVKLDWLQMLYQQKLFAETLQPDSETWWVSQFGGDSSPQKTFDFMNGIEERHIFTGSYDDVARLARDTSALRCFEYVRRTTPVQVLGMGVTDTVAKYHRTLRAMALETGVQNMNERRYTVAGWLADQGTDIHIGDIGAAGGSVPRLLEQLQNGEIEFGSPDTIDGFFLPHAIIIAESLHALFGALEDSLRATDAWAPFEGVLREMTRTVGDGMFRDRFREVCMRPRGATKDELKLMHSFEHHRFDWRWEVLETVSASLGYRWDILKRYFDYAALSKDGQLRDQGIRVLHRCLVGADDDLPACEAMVHFVLLNRNSNSDRNRNRNAKKNRNRSRNGNGNGSRSMNRDWHMNRSRNKKRGGIGT